MYLTQVQQQPFSVQSSQEQQLEIAKWHKHLFRPKPLFQLSYMTGNPLCWTVRQFVRGDLFVAFRSKELLVICTCYLQPSKCFLDANESQILLNLKVHFSCFNFHIICQLSNYQPQYCSKSQYLLIVVSNHYYYYWSADWILGHRNPVC